MATSKPVTFRPGLPGADQRELAEYIVKNGPRKTYPAGRRLRLIFNGSVIVDTTNALFVWEHDAYPQYYVPLAALQVASHKDVHVVKGDDEKPKAAVIEITVAPGGSIPQRKLDRVIRFEDDASLGPIAGLLRLEFLSIDHWLEEDVPIYRHPRDPFKRIELLLSSRPIEVRVGGQTVAKSAYSVHLLETGLPTRYYLPLSTIDQSVLRKSDTSTTCPYKGDAEWYHVELNGDKHQDLAWYYRIPTHESLGIAGLVSFFNEKVQIILDGKVLEQPQTWWS